jgi:hypothetical protein
MQSEANMLRAAQRLFAWLTRRTAADEIQQRHQAWDRDCRARGMTAREQAEELQIRCAWVRLRTKASAAALRKPARYREILDRIAADEARTLTAIGGDEFAAVFLHAYQATDPLEILSRDAAFAVRARLQDRPASIQSAPSLVPDLPPAERRQATRSRRRSTDPVS